MSRFEVRNCRLTDGSWAVVRVENGKFESILSPSVGLWEDAKTVNASGLTIIPGLCDAHVHDRHPGHPESEDFEHLERAMMIGGIVYSARMPNTDPAITTLEELEKKLQEMGPHADRIKVWFGATPDNINEIRQIAKHPAVCGVKMYMGSSTGNLLVAHQAHQQAIMEECAAAGLTVAVHAEDEQLMEENLQTLRLQRQPLLSDHCLIRDKPVEISAVKQAIELGLGSGATLHFCHISSPESLQLIRDAKDRELKATVEVCPHHLFLSNAGLIHPKHSGRFKMNPPLRSLEDMLRTQELLCRGDFVDVIATDHAPHPKARKNSEVYDDTPSGVPGVETMFPLLMRLHQEKKIALPDIVELTSTRPMQLLGLGSQKGRIKPGYDADFILLDPTEVGHIRNKDVKSKCEWTAFNGMVGYGWPKRVFIGGKEVSFPHPDRS